MACESVLLTVAMSASAAAPSQLPVACYCVTKLPKLTACPFRSWPGGEEVSLRRFHLLRHSRAVFNLADCEAPSRSTSATSESSGSPGSG